MMIVLYKKTKTIKNVWIINGRVLKSQICHGLR